MKLVNLNTAKSLQELGCTVKTEFIAVKYQKGDTEYHIYDTHEHIDLYFEYIPLPRLDDAAYWIREKHSLNIRISFWQTDEWFFDILNIETAEYYDELYEYYDTYNSALEAAVTKAIEIIKNKQHENNKI